MTQDNDTPVSGIGALDVLDFWWAAGEDKWYGGGEAFDAEIRDKFAALHQEAASGNLNHWQESPSGALALLILLDQFSRNLFRNDAHAFASDPLALAIAKNSLDKGFDRAFPSPHRGFFYLPFEHCEDIGAQERAVDLFRVMGNMVTYHYALIHMDVIRRFGRFPHRNAVLGRVSTPEEQAFLDSGGFSA